MERAPRLRVLSPGVGAVVARGEDLLKLAGRALYLVLGAILVLSYVLHRSGGDTEGWRVEARTTIAQNRTWLARSALLAGQVASARHQAKESQQALDALVARFDSIHQNATDTSATFHVLDSTCQRIIRVCYLRGQQLEMALSVSEARANVGDSLLAVSDSMLRRAVRESQCHILLVHCPSRFALFVTGGLLGSVGTTLLRH